MKRIFLTLMLSLALTFGLSAPALAFSTDTAKAEVCKGVSGTSVATCGGTTSTTDVQRIIKTIIKILSIIAGVAAVIMIIVGGMKYITSGGDSSSIASAKSTIIYALVGLIIAALAQYIVNFVLFRTL